LIDKYINFSFLLEKIRLYYSDDNGRPTDPLILFKMMFIGYIYGIRSERQLEREIRINVAYRCCQNIKKIATHLARLEKVCCNSLG
jgi:transposase